MAEMRRKSESERRKGRLARSEEGTAIAPPRRHWCAVNCDLLGPWGVEPTGGVKEEGGSGGWWGSAGGWVGLEWKRTVAATAAALAPRRPRWRMAGREGDGAGRCPMVAWSF